MRLALVAVCALLVSGCLGGKPPGGGGPDGPSDGRVQPMPAGDYRAVLETSLGNFTIELWEDRAPLAVANFLQYAEDGHYTSTVFHRIVRGFVVQGGGFAAPFRGNAMPKPTHGPIPLEIPSGNAHEIGTVGMARTNDPDSGTSQWFVNTARNSGLDAGYTVFGRVVEGMETVQRIESVAVDPETEAPLEDVVIRRVLVQVPSGAGAPQLLAYAPSYGVARGGNLTIPLFLKNVGPTRMTAQLSATAPAGATVEFPVPARPLSAGQAQVVIASVQAGPGFEGGTVEFRAASGDRSSATSVPVAALNVSGPAAGAERPYVSVHYLGLYDNGVVFDTTATGLAQRGFPVASRFQEHADPLRVYVGDGRSPNAQYTNVIPGFANGAVGLRQGETRTVRLTPEEGYRDGNFRVFEIRVASLDG
ncbi:MAG TPA: peptidylprolyl isomerase [Candidatus Thermoplasmatota archaeon]|nr:peptidylprolyl isomerase [Candidatus Thermoplasmatota archaeon]